MAGDLSLGAGPEEASRAHSLALGKAPQRDAAVPAAIAYDVGVGDGVARVLRLVVERIGNQAVMFGIETGDDGEVIGKRERGIAGHHAFRRPYSFFAQGQQIYRAIMFCIIPAETVER